MGKIKDITGQQFGRLVAMEPTDERYDGRVVWLCRCDCGGKSSVCSSSLVKGTTRSCGCLLREASAKKAKDITGQRFGRLVAVEPTSERRNENVVWLCHCECGNRCNVPVTSLINGNTCSCGCLRVDVSKMNMDAHVGRVEGTQLSRLQKKGFGSSSTGVRGVSFRKDTGTYVARITLKRKTVYLGSFPTLEEAAKARTVAEAELFDPILEKYGMKREE